MLIGLMRMMRMIMPFGVPRKTNQTAQPTSGCSGNEGADGGG